MLIRAVAFLMGLFGLGAAAGADPYLADFPYPHPVERFELVSQGEPVWMSYMDEKPKKPNGLTIVLLHGYPTSSFMFRHLIPRLAAQFRVIAPDHLGFGLSDAPLADEFTYTFDALAGLTAELLVSNYSNRSGDFDPQRLHALLSSPAKRDRVAARLAGSVADQGWDGVNVDLERVRAADGDGLVAFVQALQDLMPAARTVSIDISAATSARAYRDRGYRLAGLRDAADVIDLMTYDDHGPGWSGPGPVGPLAWQRSAMVSLLEQVPPRKARLGFGGYGYTWPRHGAGRSVTDAEARELVAADGATAVWNSVAGEWTARLSDGTVLWWADARSYALRLRLARDLGVGGLAVWRIGSVDPLT